MTDVLVNGRARKSAPLPSKHARKRGKSPDTGQRQEKEQPRLNLGEIVSWLSFAAAIVAPFYILGIVFLASQIAQSYHLDFVTAWYAASSVSRLSILGVSVEILRTGWVTIVLQALAGISYMIFYGKPQKTFDRAQSTDRDKPWIVTLNKRAYIIPKALVSSFSGIIVTIFIAKLVQIAKHESGIAGLAIPLEYLIYMAVVVCATTLVISIPWPLRWRIVLMIAYLYIQAVVIELLQHGIGTPRLPQTELNIDASQRVQGQLLTHADGYWYMLLHDPGRLAAIPNDTAKAVISPPPQTATAVPASTPIPAKTP